jgi:branched-chain amino acid aminotransferase
MTEPLAYFNGRFVPCSAACIPLYDAGFVLGATVTEQLRTFGGRLFRLPQHLARLAHSLDIVGLQPVPSLDHLAGVAARLAEENHRLLPPEADLGLCIFLTPGPYAAFAPEGAAGPTVGVHTYPLRFELWSHKYAQGDALASVGIRQVPRACWPADLKCRSRMHYFLADREAHAAFPGARALLLDLDDHVTEASTANLVVVRGGQLFSPPLHRVLPGISLQVVTELAASLGLPFHYCDLQTSDVAAADEVLLTATSYCILPVTRFNGQCIGTGRPGPVFEQLISAWSALVGVDIVAQADRCGAGQYPRPQGDA